MAERKTKATAVAPADFIAAVSDPVRRADAETLCALMARLSGEPAAMWGPTIIGFGSYSYTYDSGHSGEMCRIGFSPRKAEQVLYVLGGGEAEAELLARLGKHRTGKSCLYIKRLADVDMGVLEAVIAASLARMDAAYPR
jgi:hypothetical protein